MRWTPAARGIMFGREEVISDDEAGKEEAPDPSEARVQGGRPGSSAAPARGVDLPQAAEKVSRSVRILSRIDLDAGTSTQGRALAAIRHTDPCEGPPLVRSHVAHRTPPLIPRAREQHQ